MGTITAKPRILVAEDSVYLADMIVTFLKETGWETVGPVPSLDAALRLAREQRLDAAILDVRLRDADIYPVASLLASRGVPFMFLTGVDEDSVAAEFSAAPCVRKPFEWSTVRSTLLYLLNRRADDR